MRFHTTDKVRLSIPKAALIAIFDECDGFNHDETGGRVIGTFERTEANSPSMSQASSKPGRRRVGLR